MGRPKGSLGKKNRALLLLSGGTLPIKISTTAPKKKQEQQQSQKPQKPKQTTKKTSKFFGQQHEKIANIAAIKKKDIAATTSTTTSRSSSHELKVAKNAITRKMARVIKHRSSFYSKLPTRSKVVIPNNNSNASAAGVTTITQPSQFLNEQLLELNTLMTVDTTPVVENPGGIDDDDGYYVPVYDNSINIVNDYELEAHELYLRMGVYLATCRASGISSKTPPDPGSTLFNTIMFMEAPIFVDIEAQYRTCASYISARVDNTHKSCDRDLCKLVYFDSTQFWSSLVGRWVKPTGAVTFCCDSMRIHVCKQECSWMQMMTGSGEGWKCPASQRVIDSVLIKIASTMRAENYQRALNHMDHAEETLARVKRRVDWDPEYAKRKESLDRSLHKKNRLADNCWAIAGSSSKLTSSPSTPIAALYVPDELIGMAIAMNKVEDENERNNILDISLQIAEIKKQQHSSTDDVSGEEDEEEGTTTTNNKKIGKKQNPVHVTQPGALFPMIMKHVENSIEIHCINVNVFQMRLEEYLDSLQTKYHAATDRIISSHEKINNFENGGGWIVLKNKLSKDVIFDPMTLEAVNSYRIVKPQWFCNMAQSLYNTHKHMLRILIFRIIIMLIIRQKRYPGMFDSRVNRKAKPITEHEISILPSQVLIMLCKIVQFKECALDDNATDNNAKKYTEECTTTIRNIHDHIPPQMFLCMLISKHLRTELAIHVLIRCHVAMPPWNNKIPTTSQCLQLITAYEKFVASDA